MASHSESVSFKITDPHLRPKMAEHGVYWSRFQSKHDKFIYFLCGKFKAAGLIHARFVDRFHVSNILLSATDAPISITDASDFLAIFSPEDLYKMRAVFSEHCPNLLLPEPDLALLAPEPETEMRSRPGGVIIDAVDES